MIGIKNWYPFILILLISCSSSEKGNVADRLECQWQKDEVTLKKTFGTHKGEKVPDCSKNKKPVSKRLNDSLEEDAVKVKDFFGID